MRLSQAQEDHSLRSDDFLELGVMLIFGVTVPICGFYAAKNKSACGMCCFAGCNFLNVITCAIGESLRPFSDKPAHCHSLSLQNLARWPQILLASGSKDLLGMSPRTKKHIAMHRRHAQA